MCFTAKEVCRTPEYIELLTTFNSVLNKYKEVKKENKILNQDFHSLQLHNESLISEVKSYVNIHDDLDKIKKIHSKTVKENENLKEKNLSLEKEISEVKAKYEEISANVKEFNKGKESFMICLNIKIMIRISLVWVLMKLLQRKDQRNPK